MAGMARESESTCIAVKEPSIAASSRDRSEPWSTVTTVGGRGLAFADVGRLTIEITIPPFGNGLPASALCACVAVGSLCQTAKRLNRREIERAAGRLADKSVAALRNGFVCGVPGVHPLHYNCLNVMARQHRA